MSDKETPEKLNQSPLAEQRLMREAKVRSIMDDLLDQGNESQWSLRNICRLADVPASYLTLTNKALAEDWQRRTQADSFRRRVTDGSASQREKLEHALAEAAYYKEAFNAVARVLAMQALLQPAPKAVIESPTRSIGPR